MNRGIAVNARKHAKAKLKAMNSSIRWPQRRRS